MIESREIHHVDTEKSRRRDRLRNQANHRSAEVQSRWATPSVQSRRCAWHLFPPPSAFQSGAFSLFSLRASVLLIRDLFARCANFRTVSAARSWHPSPTPLLFPEGDKHHSPGSRPQGGHPGFEPPSDPTLKGLHIVSGPAPAPCGTPSGFVPSRHLTPGCATRASRPWAVMCDPVGVGESRLSG